MQTLYEWQAKRHHYDIIYIPTGLIVAESPTEELAELLVCALNKYGFAP